MTKKEKIEDRAWNVIRPIAAEKGYVLVDAEYLKESGGNVLRLYIDKKGGITIDDCEEMSHAVDPVLDSDDFIGEPYVMEVSSPGLGRVLKRPHDFEFAMGKDIEVRTYKAVGKKKEFTGKLTAFSEESITIVTNDGEITIPRADTSLIRLTFEF